MGPGGSNKDVGPPGIFMQEIKFTSDITVKLIQSVGGDAMVCAAAKVSTSGEEAVKLVDEEANFGLIKYLLKHKHGTTTEHSSLTFFVHAPIFVFREMHRHRIGVSFNEESGRYKQLDPIFWIPKRSRKIIPSEKHKSARPDFIEGSNNQYCELVDRLKTSYTQSYNTYSFLLEDGFAKEVSRACLPVAIYSSCWFTCNPRSLMHFLSLRTHEPEKATFVSYPQAEIEEVARSCEEVFRTGWPLTYRAWNESGRVAP